MTRTARMARSLAWIWIPALLAGCWDGGGGDDAPAGHTIGGSIAGLSATGLVLADGTASVSPSPGASTFTFPAALPDGVAYTVTVATQPTGETCSVSHATGTLAAADVVDVAVVCTPAGFTVGGSITGLTSAGLVLANGTDRLEVSASATGFTLPTSVAQGAAYAVTVQTQPAGEQCSLSQSAGTIDGGNVTNVAVACAAVTHLLGGTISGLASSGLVLANGSDALSPPPGAQAFTFALPVAEGGAYAVSVRTQPAGETCSVGAGTGTVGTGDVGTVAITCSANAYRVGGAIAGLTGNGLILANGTDTVGPASGATGYVFPNPVAFGGAYTVVVQQQPAGLTCAVAGSFPATMGAADVTNIDVTCTPSTGLYLVAGAISCPMFTSPSIDGQGANASVPAGEGLVFDGLGNLYVTGLNSKTVRKVTPGGDVTTIAGQYAQGGAADGTGGAASFGGPRGIALDAGGNLYVADPGTVRLVTQAGVVTTLAGTPTAPRGFVDGTGSAARFGGLSNIVADTAGNAYIADPNNNVIRKMTPAGVVTTFAGGGGGTASGFVDGTGTAARFAAPVGLAIDAAGTLYVADYYNWAIRKITPAGVVTTLAGGGPTNPGFADGVGASARFGGSTGLAMAPGGGIYVLDQSFDAVRLVSAAGVVTTLGSSGVAPTGPISPTAFTWPQVNQVPGIGADPSGSLYLSAGCAVLKAGP